MNIIIFPRPRTRLTHVNYLYGWNKIGALLGLIALTAALLSGGYLLGVSLGHKAILSEWKTDVVEHTASLNLIKQESQTEIDALTTKEQKT